MDETVMVCDVALLLPLRLNIRFQLPRFDVGMDCDDDVESIDGAGDADEPARFDGCDGSVVELLYCWWRSFRLPISFFNRRTSSFTRMDRFAAAPLLASALLMSVDRSFSSCSAFETGGACALCKV